jgi:hypothetical protein
MKKLTTILVALAAILVLSNSVNAQALQASYSVNENAPFAVKYLGNDENYLTFRIAVQPTLAKRSTLVISDKSEGEIYVTGLNSRYAYKTIKIEKREGQELSFKLVSGGKTYSKSFSVNTSNVETTTVSERDITRL